MRAYSSMKDVYNSGIDSAEYTLMEREGVCRATLDCKRWGKNRNILAYFTLETGEKVLASAWQNTGYLGIPEIPMGSRLELTFQKAKNGISYLRKVEEVTAP